MCEIYHADYKEKDACQLAQHLSLSDIDISIYYNNSCSILRTSGKISFAPFLCNTNTFPALSFNSFSNLPSTRTGILAAESKYSFFIYFSVIGHIFLNQKSLLMTKYFSKNNCIAPMVLLHFLIINPLKFRNL